jgi:hypothetical protein
MEHTHDDIAELDKFIDILLSAELPEYRFHRIDQNKCSVCDIELTYFSSYQRVCKICGQLVDFLFQKPEAYVIKYKRLIYFKTHLFILIGQDKNHMPTEVSREVKLYIHDNHINGLNIYTIRNILKFLKLTKYNRMAPKLLAQFGTVEMPTYSHSEITEMCRMFNQIEYHLFTTLKQNAIRKNSPLYTFIAFRIITALYPDERSPRLSQFIFFSDMTTLNKQNEIWREICTLMKMTYSCLSIRI